MQKVIFVQMYCDQRRHISVQMYCGQRRHMQKAEAAITREQWSPFLTVKSEVVGSDRKQIFSFISLRVVDVVSSPLHNMKN